MTRDLVAAASAPLALEALDGEERHGFAVLQRVREARGGRIEWPDGMFYPLLHRLERLGLLASRWEVTPAGRRRKYYWLTPTGRT